MKRIEVIRPVANVEKAFNAAFGGYFTAFASAFAIATASILPPISMAFATGAAVSARMTQKALDTEYVVDRVTQYGPLKIQSGYYL